MLLNKLDTQTEDSQKYSKMSRKIYTYFVGIICTVHPNLLWESFIPYTRTCCKNHPYGTPEPVAMGIICTIHLNLLWESSVQYSRTCCLNHLYHTPEPVAGIVCTIYLNLLQESSVLYTQTYCRNCPYCALNLLQESCVP